MGVLITDNFDRRRESRVETAIIKVLQTEIPVEKYVSEVRTRITGYIDFRIEHLSTRYAGGEQDAYIRLTEIEAMRDFVEKIAFGGQNNS